MVFANPTFDGQTIRMLADLILEPVRNGLIDLLRFKLDESPGWMKTLGPESCLSWCKTGCAGGMFHLDASKSFCFFALNIPSYPKHAGTTMSSLATILKELLLQGALRSETSPLFSSLQSSFGQSSFGSDLRNFPIRRNNTAKDHPWESLALGF